MPKRIIVIGDIILDANHYVESTRTAAEANVPVYTIINTQNILGGAANVAKNINNLCSNVTLISIVGNDANGQIITKLLDDASINHKLLICDRHTTTKTRLIHKNNIVNRHDLETTDDISVDLETEILEYLYSLPDIHSIVISDYNKGVVTTSLCEKIIRFANENGIYTFVDPKTTNYMKYKGCFLFKPNLNEGKQIANAKNKYDVVENIKRDLECKHVVLTCSEEGIYYNHFLYKPLNNNINVIDVTGCGDTVLSVLVYSWLINADINKAIRVANYVAKKSTCVIGNYNLTRADIAEYVNPVIYDSETDQIANLKKIYDGSNVVFTNGCFDIIHSAHIRLFNFCKKQGDVLIVGLNTDESIKRFKGESRPINNIEERCNLLINLNIIDHIIIFGDDSPLNILKQLRPNIMIKGGDYTKESVIGGEHAGNVIIFDYINDISTTNTIFKINKSYMNL